MAYYRFGLRFGVIGIRRKDLEEIAENISAGEAICTKREVVAVVDRLQDIEDDEAMSFFGGEEGDADPSQG